MRSEKRGATFGLVRALTLLVLALMALAASPAGLHGQATRADSAATLLQAARVLEARGEIRLARELLRVLAERFPETSTAAIGRQVSRQMADDESLVGFNRAGFIAYHTAFGAWLGVVIPAALEADGSEAYGAGLLVGAPLGFFGSRALAQSRNLSSGQAALVQFGSTWGTWQAVGWEDLFGGHVEYDCVPDACYSSGSDTGPWVAALIGGVAGLGAGIVASRIELTQGQAAVVTQSALWGTWYGAALATLAGVEGESVLAAALLAGNFGLLSAIPAARSWRPTAAKVRTITAAGLGGGLAGLGVVLLTSTDGTKGVLDILTAGTTRGLLGGAALVRDRAETGGGNGGAAEPVLALVNHRGGWSLGMPSIVPAVLPAPEGSRRYSVPGVRVGLLHITW